MSSSLKYKTKLYFLSTNMIEYIISSTDNLNELVNSNDNHVHTIIVYLCEPLGLSYLEYCITCIPMPVVVLRTLVYGASNHDVTVHGSRDESEINHSFKHVRLM